MKRSHEVAAARQVASAPQYYEAKGGADAAALAFWLPVVGGVGAVVVGGTYAFFAALFWEVESTGWMWVATPLFALCVAGVAYLACELGRVRGRGWRVAVGLVVGAVVMYGAWGIYLKLVATESVFHPMPAWAMSPGRLGHAMAELARSRGAASWLEWGVEMAVVLGAVAYCLRTDAEEPFCEKCGRWAGVTLRLEYGDALTDAIAERFRHEPVAALGELVKRKPGASHYVAVRVKRCPCYASRYASLERVAVTRGKGPGVDFKSYGTGRQHLTFDPGSPTTEDVTAVVSNLAIDVATMDALERIRAEAADA